MFPHVQSQLHFVVFFKNETLMWYARIYVCMYIQTFTYIHTCISVSWCLLWLPKFWITVITPFHLWNNTESPGGSSEHSEGLTVITTYQWWVRSVTHSLWVFCLSTRIIWSEICHSRKVSRCILNPAQGAPLKQLSRELLMDTPNIFALPICSQ